MSPAFAGLVKQFPFKGKLDRPLVLPRGGVFMLCQAKMGSEDTSLTELLIDSALGEKLFNFNQSS